MRSRPLASLAAVAVLAACGGESGRPRSGETTASVPARPVGAAPFAPRSGEPPSAWVETASGSHWLGHSSYCWSGAGTGLCADFAAPECGAKGTPDVEVTDGELVRFHLGFDPEELSLTVGPGHGRAERLEAERVVEWRVRGQGELTLFATAAGKGDASYVACLRARR
jgi:hypothetical protein